MSCNNRIIDRSGVYTIITEQDFSDFCHKNYKGYEIDSYGIQTEIIRKRFDKLFEHINERGYKNIWSENFVGEMILKEKVEYQPNNSMYGMGKESIKNLREYMLKTSINEKEIIDSALKDLQFFNVEEESKETLKNPTFCSLIAQSIFPEVSDETVWRYPASTHYLLDECYKKQHIFGMSYIKTTIK